jgi:hypothetical protein
MESIYWLKPLLQALLLFLVESLLPAFALSQMDTRRKFDFACTLRTFNKIN